MRLLLYGLVLVVFFLVGGLLRGLKREESPFNAANVRRLKWVSWLFAGQVGLVVVKNWLLPFAWAAAGVSEGLNIVLVNEQLVFPLAMMLSSWAMALVFQRGAALQRQSDETL